VIDLESYQAAALTHAHPGDHINRPVLDERDAAFIAAAMASLDALEGPRVGDFVRFACGTLRRISHAWDDGPQTSDGGSWHLGRVGKGWDDEGRGFVSFSGSLHRTVPWSTLTRTDERRLGLIWTFHHDHACAHNGVTTSVPFRVYTCTERAS
jgi:hypothetical protein